MARFLKIYGAHGGRFFFRRILGALEFAGLSPDVGLPTREHPQHLFDAVERPRASSGEHPWSYFSTVVVQMVVLAVLS